MTQDFAKPSTTKKPGAPKKKGASGKAKRPAAKKQSKKPVGATTPPPVQAPQKSKAPFYFSLIALMAAFAYGIYFLQAIPPTVIDEKTIAKSKTPPQAKQVETKPEDKNETKRFNFYDILPKTTVTPPKVEEYKYREKTATGGYHFMIQTGSFKQRQDAERQKATIALQGLKSRIKTINTKHGSTWHRVETGPYKDRSKLNSALDKLVSINIQPLVKKIKIED